MRIYGNGYLGSDSLQTSTENYEVIPQKPDGWSHGYNCWRFEWMNDQEAVVLINGKTRLFIRAGQGYKIDAGSQPIYSFIVETPDVTFNWNGDY